MAAGSIIRCTSMAAQASAYSPPTTASPRFRRRWAQGSILPASLVSICWAIAIRSLCVAAASIIAFAPDHHSLAKTPSRFELFFNHSYTSELFRRKVQSTLICIPYLTIELDNSSEEVEQFLRKRE